MKGCRKGDPPAELVDWLAMESPVWTPAYPFDDPTVRESVVDACFREQRGLCVYCGRRLDLAKPGKSYHIEHFRPQKGPNGRPDLAVDHSNLMLSCGQQDHDGNTAQTCGTQKADWFDESTCIEPEYPTCTMRFRFLLSGKIIPAREQDGSADTMIAKLALNHPEFIKDREEVLRLLDSDELDVADFWDDMEKLAESYAHVAYQYTEQTLP